MQKRVTIASVRNNGCALSYAPAEHRADRDVVLVAVQHSGCALQYAAPMFRSDREMVLVAVKSEGEALRYTTTGVQSDRGVVLAAVKSDGYALRYAGTELKSDREVVLTAVNNIQFEDEGLRAAVTRSVTDAARQGLAAQLEDMTARVESAVGSTARAAKANDAKSEDAAQQQHAAKQLARVEKSLSDHGCALAECRRELQSVRREMEGLHEGTKLLAGGPLKLLLFFVLGFMPRVEHWRVFCGYYLLESGEARPLYQELFKSRGKWLWCILTK